MDEAKRAELENRVKDCELKISIEMAKKSKYETQLRVGKTRQTKNKPKQGQKGGKPIPKQGENSTKDENEKGFFETIFS